IPTTFGGEPIKSYHILTRPLYEAFLLQTFLYCILSFEHHLIDVTYDFISISIYHTSNVMYTSH
ncbi:hypothetical protein, partial [Staphylococcus aureus]|uniref:hypothetical protein n=2 Tax=Staphylococcus aureus TaxID=1280 RepID=UPI001F2CE9FA